MRENGFNALNVIKEILGFIGVTVGIFAWMMIMQLIVSFVALSYLHMQFTVMIAVSVCVTAGFDIYYVIHRVRRKRKQKEILRRISSD